MCHTKVSGDEGVTKHHLSIYVPLSDRFKSFTIKYYFAKINLQLSDYF